MKRQIKIVAVTGADSGLGKCIVAALRPIKDVYVIEVNGPDGSFGYGSFPSDLTDPYKNEGAALNIRAHTERLIDTPSVSSYYPILINCAGVNYIEWFDQADFHQFDRLMEVNVKAGLMLIQNLIGKMPPIGDGFESTSWFNGTGAILNIVSNASHVPMTNSAFYNATKGAFHIATLSLARELRKTHGICVFGISPNKLSGTGMSRYIEGRVPSIRGWSPEEAMKYQLAALPAGEETDPEVLADFIAYLLAEPVRHKYLTGTIIPYGA